MSNLISSQLYITEASESKEKTEQELKTPDPKDVSVADLLKNDSTDKSHGK
jgi:hypothetical protein